MPWQGEFRHAQTTSALGSGSSETHRFSRGSPGIQLEFPGIRERREPRARYGGAAGVFTDWRVCLPMRTLGVNDFGYSLRVECKSYEMAVY